MGFIASLKSPVSARPSLRSFRWPIHRFLRIYVFEPGATAGAPVVGVANQLEERQMGFLGSLKVFLNYFVEVLDFIPAHVQYVLI